MKPTLLSLSLIVSLLTVSAAGQTQVDLRTQAKDVDFSGASSTKPIQMGAALPSTCAAGQTFLLSNASMGQNLYVCTAASVWTRQGGAAMVSQLNDFATTWTSATALTIGANCASATPCNLRLGSTVYSFTQSCTANISAGTGTAYVYFASTGALTIGHNVTVSSSAGCQTQTGVTNFPAGSIPLATWTATSGTWDTAGGLDYRAMLAAKGIAPGTGLLTVDAAGNTTISVDSAVVPTYLTGTAVLDFPSIPNGACAAELSFTLAGVAVNDGVEPGWPNAIEPGLVGTMRVSAPNTIAVRLCNLSGGALDPASATFRATIVRSF
jgi:hypothetical protein